MLIAVAIVIAVLLVLGLSTLGASIRVLREYERGVVFRLGRLMELRGPGLQLLIPSLDRMVRVSLRTVTLAVPPQEVITRDNVPARVTAVAYYRVIDPNKAVTAVENFQAATLQIAQTTLRSILGVADLDTLLSEREKLNESLAEVIDTQTEPWGIKVTTVEIKDVEIPERMQHALARQAEAERERRAKIIDAEGEFQQAAKLAEAADVMSHNPVTLQLRYLQTLREIGGQQNSTIVFPMPVDLMRPMLETLGQGGAAAAAPQIATPAATTPQIAGPPVEDAARSVGHELGSAPAPGLDSGPPAEELPASMRERNGQTSDVPPVREPRS
jgi:regulator of protease activity HflC (stomatin/prohibitin superfamily)